MNKLSVVISAYNEEQKIEDCLKSVKFADEIIVVNNSSTDKTEEISRRYTKTVFNQPNNPDRIDLQKNFGFQKATGDFILSLDADERVSPELAQEIREIIGNWKLETGNSACGYWIPRKNIIFGKWIEHTGWYPDYQLRFFRKGFGKFESEHVHEFIKVDGKTEHLENHLIHENYDNINQFAKKTFIYAQNEAESLLKNGYKFSFFDAVRFPSKEFLSRFFAREGYKDGFFGLMLSVFMAFYHFLVFAHIWEIEKYKQMDQEELLRAGKRELKQVSKEMNYWILNTEIRKTKNAAKKIFLRAKRKLSL
jgi:glycosyltransferase involved in cell wall biosynthesis